MKKKLNLNAKKSATKSINALKTFTKLHSVEVTNECIKIRKNAKLHLSIFLFLMHYQSGALMDVAKQTPVMKYNFNLMT